MNTALCYIMKLMRQIPVACVADSRLALKYGPNRPITWIAKYFLAKKIYGGEV